jgi:hypothetical protein
MASMLRRKYLVVLEDTDTGATNVHCRRWTYDGAWDTAAKLNRRHETWHGELVFRVVER